MQSERAHNRAYAALKRDGRRPDGRREQAAGGGGTLAARHCPSAQVGAACFICTGGPMLTAKRPLDVAINNVWSGKLT